ncbi:MAG: hypothetical protein RIF41_32285 [Polyangiaceae bacterium]
MNVQPQITRTGGAERPPTPPATSAAPGPVLLTDWRKVCACGRAHNWHQWCRLERVGLTVHDYDDGQQPSVEVLEYRNCPCRSTLAVDLLEIVDIIRPGGGS